MGKKMNLSVLKQLETKAFTTKTLKLDKYEIEVDEVFRESKILDLFKEFVKNIHTVREMGQDFLEIYVVVLVIKHFTTIDFPEKVELQIQTVNILADLGYLQTVIGAFAEGEFDRFAVRFDAYAQEFKHTADEHQEPEAETKAEEEQL